MEKTIWRNSGQFPFTDYWSSTSLQINEAVPVLYLISWCCLHLKWVEWEWNSLGWPYVNEIRKTLSFVLMQLCEAKFNTVLERILWGYTFQFCLHWTQTNNKTSLADISKLTQKRLLDKCDDFGHSCANCYHPWTHWGDW